LKSVKFWLSAIQFNEERRLDLGIPLWITCYAETSDETVVKYTWFKKSGSGNDDFIEIPQNSSRNGNREIKFLKTQDTKHEVILPKRSSLLDIHSLQVTDYGIYLCKAQVIGLNQTKTSPEIRINDQLEPPKFEPMPSKKVVLENDNVTLCCNVSGNPQSLVLWYRLNNLTMPNGQKKILVEVNNSLATLTIKNVKRNQKGAYYCKSARTNGFTNTPRLQTKGKIDLTVYYPPEVKPKLQEIRISKSKTARLTCNVQASNPKRVHIKWKKDGKVLEERSKTLKLKIVDYIQDYGLYECEISNKAGFGSCRFNVSGIAYAPEFYYNSSILTSGFDDSLLTMKGSDTRDWNGPSAQFDYHLYWTQKKPGAVDVVSNYRIKWRLLNRQDKDRNPRATAQNLDWSEEIKEVLDNETDDGHLFSWDLKNLSMTSHKIQSYEVVLTPFNKIGEGDSSRRIIRLQRSTRNIRWDSDDHFFCGFCDTDCGFIQDARNKKDFNWTRNSNETWNGKRTRGTGPLKDRTDNIDIGGYMYVESSLKKKGAKARLISPIFESSMKCLKFYYHMRGRTIGKLSVKLRDESGKETVVWERKGNQSEAWKVDNIGFNQTNAFSVVFEALMTEKENYLGDIAIDDILVDKTPCAFIPTSTPIIKAGGSNSMYEYSICNFVCFFFNVCIQLLQINIFFHLV